MEARNRTIPEWFNRIRTGQIRLPRFQRFEAWSANEVSSVLDAVLRGLPIGATLVLEVGDKEQFMSRGMIGVPPSTERATENLLDGQQRLTALWRSFHDDYEDRTYFVAFWNDGDTGKETASVFSRGRYLKNNQRYPLWADSPKEVSDRGLIPIKILRPGDLNDEVWNWCETAADGDNDTYKQLLKRITELRQAVQGYNIPFLSLPATTPREVALDVFIKLNTSSVRLTSFDIIVAQVEEETGESLHDLVATLKTSIPTLQAYIDPSDLVLNAAALREDRGPNQASYFRLDLEQLVLKWDSLTRGIAWAIQLLEEERIFDSARLPTVAVLPVLAALHEHMPASLDRRGNANTLIRKYLWRAFFTRRYESAAASAALQDMRALRALLQDETAASEVPIFDETQYPLPTVEDLKLSSWPKGRETMARGILAVTLKAGALDLADDTQISRAALAKREYHHLFPQSLLTGQAGLSSQESSRALNCALVTWNTNRNISAKEPLTYLAERTQRSSLGEQEIRTRLASHLIPYEPLAVGGYDNIQNSEERQGKIRQDYETFLTERAELLLSRILLLCEGKRWPEAG